MMEIRRKATLLGAVLALLVMSGPVMSANASPMLTQEMEMNDRQEKTFVASDMSGRNETPSVDTPATGEAVFMVDKSAKEIRFTLTVQNINNPTAAHIHLGSAGQKGGVIVNLFPIGSDQARPGNFSGRLSSGTITERELTGSMDGRTLDDLVREMKNGNTYVNVHTNSHPDGEIRAQIRMIDSDKR